MTQTQKRYFTIFVVSLLALIANDHFFKGSIFGGAVTGKVSDFAGLIVAPVMLVAAYSLVWRRLPGGVSFWALFLAAPLVFSLINMFPEAARVMENLIAVFSGGAIAWKIWSDPSDLAALVVLPLAYRVSREVGAQFAGAGKNYFKKTALGLSVAATLFTSQPPGPPQFDEPFHKRGCIVQTVSVTSTTIGIAWSRAVDEEPLEYQVYSSLSPNIDTVDSMQANGVLELDWILDVDSYTLSGLTPNTVYYINVLTRDVDNNYLAYCMIQSQTLP